jgi:hypothetical protein
MNVLHVLRLILLFSCLLIHRLNELCSQRYYITHFLCISMIQTSTNLDASPKDAMSLFEFSQLETTVKIIDPFFERIALLFEPSKDLKVFRRTTPKLALLPRRDFTLASFDGSQQQATSFPVTNSKHSSLKNVNDDFQSTIPKGTLYQQYISVRPNSEYTVTPYPSQGKYIKSFQDSVVWFIDDGQGGTNLVSIMQVDLGADVPRLVAIYFLCAIFYIDVPRVRFRVWHLCQTNYGRNSRNS